MIRAVHCDFVIDIIPIEGRRWKIQLSRIDTALCDELMGERWGNCKTKLALARYGVLNTTLTHFVDACSHPLLVRICI